MLPDLTYSGTTLAWMDQGVTYKATSGLLSEKQDYRNSKFVCVSDAGPLPEGIYRFSTNIAGQAPENPNYQCGLQGAYGTGIQTIPRGTTQRDPECEQYYANWGSNRVRLEAWDGVAVRACGGQRGGFYLHDSAKGYTHGCIEVETQFFERLKAYARSTKNGHKKHLLLQIKYPSGSASTYGQTDR